MTYPERKVAEASIRCEVALGMLPSITAAFGELSAQERADASRLLSEATTSLWKLHGKLGGTQ